MSSKYYGMSRPTHYRNGTFPSNRALPSSGHNARVERTPPSMRDSQVPPPSSSSPSSTATGQVIQLLPNVKHVPSYLLTSHQLGSSTESSRTNTPISANISEDLPMHLKPELAIDHLPVDSRSATPVETTWSQVVSRHKKPQHGDLHRQILKKNETQHTDDLVKNLSLRQMMGIDRYKENDNLSLFNQVSKFSSDHIVKPCPIRSATQTLGCQFAPQPPPPPPPSLPPHTLNQPIHNLNPPTGLNPNNHGLHPAHNLNPNPINPQTMSQQPPNLNMGPPNMGGPPLHHMNSTLPPPPPPPSNHFECISPMNPSMGYKPVADEPLRKKNLPKLDLPLRKPTDEDNPNHIGRHNGMKDFPPMPLGTGFSRQFSDEIETPTTVLNLVKMLDESPEKDVEQEVHELTRRHPSVTSNYSVPLTMEQHLDYHQRHIAKTGHLQAPFPAEMKPHATSGNHGNYGSHMLEREPQHPPTSLMWPMRPRLYDRSVLSSTDEPQRYIEPLTPRTPAGYGSLGDADLDALSFLRDLKIGDTNTEMQDSLY